MKRRSLCSAVALLLIVLNVQVARSDDVDAGIFRALEERTSVDFTLTPVDSAIDYLSDLHSIPINLDTEALQKAGIKPDQAVTTLELNDAPLHLALRAILEPNKLSFMIQGHVLTITTQEAAKKWQKEHAQLLK